MAILKRRPEQRLEVDHSDSVSSIDDILELVENPKHFPRDVRKILKKIGVSIRIEPMEQQKSGYLRKLDSGWVIGVNSLHHPRRQLFTMAHELGHYVLHRKTVGSFEDATLFRADNYGDWGVEREANLFAARFLMPEDEFRDAVREFDGSVKKIAEFFGVSALAVKVRANELKQGRVVN